MSRCGNHPTSAPVYLPGDDQATELPVTWDCDPDSCHGDVDLPDGFDPDAWHVDWGLADSAGVLVEVDQAVRS